MFRKNSTVAKNRLELMIEAEQLNSSPECVSLVKNEITQLLNRHFNVSSTYEIKIIVKTDEKRV